jgi:hypothetical protein
MDRGIHQDDNKLLPRRLHQKVIHLEEATRKLCNVLDTIHTDDEHRDH